MVKYTNIEPIEMHLKFGVELFELYPPWYLHPSLKNLIYLAKISIKNCNKRQYALEEFSRSNSDIQGTSHERLLLKQRLITCKNIYNLHIAPGVSIWLLRHFLELLPTPIFPPQNDAHHWINLSTKCHRSSSKEIKNMVAKELACLPAQNLTFLFEFFELIRTLATDTIVNSSISKMFVKYFASSLFIRSYLPEVSANDDHKYTSLLLFIIYFWPELRLKIHNVIITRDKNINTLYYYRDKYSEDYYKDTSRYLTDKNVQTDSTPDILTYMNSSNNFEHFDTSIADEIEVKLDDNKVQNDKNIVKVNTKHDDNKVQDDKHIVKLLNENETEKDTINKETADDEITKDEQGNQKLITSTPFKPIKNPVVDNMDTFNEMLESIRVYLTSMYNIPEIAPEKSSNHLKTNINNTSKNPTPAPRPEENNEQNSVKNKVKNCKTVSLKRQRRRRNNEIILKVKIECCNHTRKGLIKSRKQKRPTRIDKEKDKEENRNENIAEILLMNESTDSGKHTPFQSQTEMKYNSTINENDYIFDSFIGKYYDSTKLNDSSVNNSCILENCDKSTTDTNEGILKLGWTCNRGFNLNNTPNFRNDSTYIQIEPYKLCYDTEQNDSFQDALNARRNGVMDSLKRVTSKFGFLKNLTPNKLRFGRSMSNENLVSNIKYKRLPKSACSI